MSLEMLAVIPDAERRRPRVEQRFRDRLAELGHAPLQSSGIGVLQINVGKRCNQSCEHCHVDAGPDRKEVMPDSVVDAILEVLARTDIGTLDITGGAPELHDRFRDLVDAAHRLGRRVIDRSNLTLFTTPKYGRLIPFLAERKVELHCSLPSLNPRQTDLQRGAGVFERSVQALRMLNDAGYGEGELLLHLVTNPTGALLPGDQAELELMWKRDLQRRWGVRFNQLFTITNMPIARFLDFLRETGNEESYMAKLEMGFNPVAVESVMCRDMLSVAWDGSLHDCDFNQMLEMGMEDGLPATIFEYEDALLQRRPIAVGPHCYGCTAGKGSSCGGAVV